MDSFSGTNSFPEIYSNRDFSPLETIKKNTKSTHCLTLMILSLMDLPNATLEIEMICENEIQMQDIILQLHLILTKSEIIKVYIRSVKLDGKFQESFNENKLEQETPIPNYIEQFKNKSDVICDIEIQQNQYQIWKFWRFAESIPRQFKISYKKNEIFSLLK